MKTENELFSDLIFKNECSSNEKFIHRFSDPDGVRSGKSGWSFGRVQWDTRNNPTSLLCLKECGFTQDEIDGVVDQTIDVKPLAAKLAAHADIIKRYDEAQLSRCVVQAGQFAEKYCLALDGSGGLLALADTINQYGSLGDGSGAHLKALHRPVTAKDVLDMKLTWKYAKASKDKYDDTVRRYNNLVEILAKNV